MPFEDNVHRFALAHPNIIIETMKELGNKQGLEVYTTPRHMDGFNEWNTVNVELISEDIHAGFDVQQMPGCCAVLVLSYIKAEPFTLETVDTVIKFVEESARDAGFGSVVMTQVVPAFSKFLWKKQPWIKCLDRGWQHSKGFINAKSGNIVTYLMKDLGQKGKKPGMEIRVKA